MQAVDTNVLIRILVNDEKQLDQVKRARQFAKKAKRLYVSQVVQVELVWVLESAYHLEKSEIANILQHVHLNDAFELQNENEFAEALHLYQNNNVDFSDMLILAESKSVGCRVATFDKKFSKIPMVDLL